MVDISVEFPSNFKNIFLRFACAFSATVELSVMLSLELLPYLYSHPETHTRLLGGERRSLGEMLLQRLGQSQWPKEAQVVGFGISHV